MSLLFVAPFFLILLLFFFRVFAILLGKLLIQFDHFGAGIDRFLRFLRLRHPIFSSLIFWLHIKVSIPQAKIPPDPDDQKIPKPGNGG